MFERLARAVSRHWLLTLLAWMLVPLAIHQLAPDWDALVEDGDSAYLPAWMSSVRGANLQKEAFPDDHSKSQVVVVVARPGESLRPVDLAVSNWLVQQLTPEDQSSSVTSVFNYASPIIGSQLTSPVGRAGQATLVLLNLRVEMAAVENMAFIRHLRQMLDEVKQSPNYPEGLHLGITGAPAVSANIFLAAQESLRNTECTTIALVVLILVAVYRTPILVLTPLLVVLVAWTLSIDILAMLAWLSSRVDWFDLKIFRTSKIFIIVILFGATTDYCLFLISRHLEGLREKMTPPQAMENALARVGATITASGMATILGLSTMAFAQFGRFRYGGITVAVALAVALAACLTLAPALLRASGSAIFWPFPLESRSKSSNEPGNSVVHRAWEWIGHAIVTCPGRIFLGSLLIMAWPAYIGLSVPVTYDMLSELSPNQFSIRGTNLLKRYFPTGQTGPITVLIRREKGQFETEEGREALADLTGQMLAFTYTSPHGKQSHPIVNVRSLSHPLGNLSDVLNPFSSLGRRNMVARGNPEVKAEYLSQAPDYDGTVTKLDLISHDDPFSPESVRLLDQVEAQLLSMTQDPNSFWHGAEIGFVGTTAEIRDLATINRSDFIRIATLTSLVVFVVLVVLLRRLLVSLFLILSVLWGYLVTMGVSQLVFMGVTGAEFDGVAWRLPLFLFVILVAVGVDYNIYLISRVIEEQKRRGSLEGLRFALVRTGGIITSCGVIMAGTFASMLVGTLREMGELGFALAFGVLLDTCVIRTILVPSYLAFWASRSAKPRTPES